MKKYQIIISSLFLLFSLFSITHGAGVTVGGVTATVTVEVDTTGVKDLESDFIDDGNNTNSGALHTYKIEVCNNSGGNITNTLIGPLNTDVTSQMELVGTDMTDSSIVLFGTNLDDPFVGSRMPIGVFGGAMNVGLISNGSCKLVSFQVVIQQDGNLKTNDLISYKTRFKHDGMADYVDTNIVNNSANPVSVYFNYSGDTAFVSNSKTLSASVNEGTISYKTLDLGDNTCDNSVIGFTNYTGPIVFNDDVNNGKKVCFKADNGNGDIQYQLSNTLNLDTTAPNLIVNNPVDNYAQSQTFSATGSDLNNVSLEYLLLTNETCNQATYDNANMFGNPAFPTNYTALDDIIFNNESDTNKKLCFIARDDIGNYSFLAGNNIKIDTTSPIITVNNPNTNQETSKIISASVNEGTISYKILDSGDNTCDNSVAGLSNYTTSISFSSDSDNGKRVCFKAIDQALNNSYGLSDILAGIYTPAPVVKSSGGGSSKPSFREGRTIKPTINQAKIGTRKLVYETKDKLILKTPSITNKIRGGTYSNDRYKVLYEPTSYKEKRENYKVGLVTDGEIFITITDTSLKSKPKALIRYAEDEEYVEFIDFNYENNVITFVSNRGFDLKIIKNTDYIEDFEEKLQKQRDPLFSIKQKVAKNIKNLHSKKGYSKNTIKTTLIKLKVKISQNNKVYGKYTTEDLINILDYGINSLEK